MPVKKDDSGRRWVEMEFLVPGTPEQVWQAIATGPGMSAWFTPTTVDERVGGAIIRFRRRQLWRCHIIWIGDRLGAAAPVRLRGARVERRRSSGGNRGRRHQSLRRPMCSAHPGKIGTTNWRASRAGGPASSRCCACT